MSEYVLVDEMSAAIVTTTGGEWRFGTVDEAEALKVREIERTNYTSDDHPFTIMELSVVGETND